MMTKLLNTITVIWKKQKNSMSYQFHSSSKENTIEFASELAPKLKSGSVICFYGDLGAGKTTFIKGLAKGLNIKESVQSPTFNIMKLYFSGDRPLIHIDAYRLEDNENDIGLDEYIGYEKGITVIEWPMYIQKLLPSQFIKVDIEYLNENERVYTLENVEGIIDD